MSACWSQHSTLNKYLHPRFSIYSVSLSVAHSYCYTLYYLSFLQMLILVSGVVYHNKILHMYPKYRYVDIGIVLFGLYHHLDHYYTNCETSEYLFIGFYLTGIFFYFLGLFTCIDAYHCGVHILPTLGNIVIHYC